MFIIATLCLSIALNVLLIWFVRKVQTDYILFIRDSLEGLVQMHQEFNEHLGRKKGYSLNMIGKFLNWILTKFFSKYYSNVAVFICKKNK